MKFNPVLKSELQKWEEQREKKCDSQGNSEADNLRAHDPRQSIAPICYQSRGQVLGTSVLWKPISREARKLISKAPWWAHPPPEKLLAPIPEPQTRKEKRMSQSPTQSKTNHPAQAPGMQEGEIKHDDVFNAEIAQNAINRTGRTISNLDTLVDKAMDARAALDVMCDRWKVSWMDFIDESESRLKWLRETRYAFDSETRQLMAGLRDVRQFFLDEKHDTEVARLREFVDLCERLQRLKASGFLDTVADTILKLE